MGWFDFGSGGDTHSTANTSDTNTSSSNTDQSGALSAGFGAVKSGGGRDSSVTLTDSRRFAYTDKSQGITGGDALAMLGLVLDANKQTAALAHESIDGSHKFASEATQQLGLLASSASGSQTETGRLIGKLAVPVLAALGGLIVLYLILRKKR